jgi:hypothetical protein
MMLRFSPLLLLLVAAAATAVGAELLTEEDIIAKEIAWAKRRVDTYRQGFKADHPLQWTVHDEALFAMPPHDPVMFQETQKAANEHVKTDNGYNEQPQLRWNSGNLRRVK